MQKGGCGCFTRLMKQYGLSHPDFKSHQSHLAFLCFGRFCRDGNPQSTSPSSKFQISNSKSQIQNPKFKIPNPQSQIPNLKIPNSKFQIPNPQSAISNLTSHITHPTSHILHPNPSLYLKKWILLSDSFYNPYDWRFNLNQREHGPRRKSGR